MIFGIETEIRLELTFICFHRDADYYRKTFNFNITELSEAGFGFNL